MGMRSSSILVLSQHSQGHISLETREHLRSHSIPNRRRSSMFLFHYCITSRTAKPPGHFSFQSFNHDFLWTRSAIPNRSWGKTDRLFFPWIFGRFLPSIHQQFGLARPGPNGWRMFIENWRKSTSSWCNFARFHEILWGPNFCGGFGALTTSWITIWSPLVLTNISHEWNPGS